MIPHAMLNQFIFFPDRELFATPDAYGLKAEDIWLSTADDVCIHGWFFPREDARATLLFLHGNAGNISHRLDNVRLLLDLNVQVFILDYRGYGQSESNPDEAGTYADALAAWQWMLGKSIGPHLIFGRSLGGAVAIWLAVQAEVEPAAVIIENTFASGRGIAGKLLPVPAMAALLPNFYPSIDRIALIDTPLLLIHGEADELIPVAHGQRLFAAARAPKKLYLVPGGHHNDAYSVGGIAYWQQWREFLESSISA